MQKISFILAMVLVGFWSCTKDERVEVQATRPVSHQSSLNYGNAYARYSGPNYSQSIPVDTANQMIGAYLSAVGYPTTDTALRSMVFDADTLRAYLMNPNIATLKIMLAHKHEYSHSNNPFLGSPTAPQALTFVMVGLNENDQYVLNTRGQVYDHVFNCPDQCAGTNNALIQ